MSGIFRYNFPTTIYFGAGARARIADSLKARGAKRPLIVTDEGLAKLPLIAALQGDLNQAGLHAGLFGGVAGNPVKSQVTAGVEAYRATGADAIVGVGGGASIDVAKAIALMAHHPGDLFDYEDEKPGARPIDQPIPVFFAVPTTAGTGSEVGRSTVVSDDATHVKKIIFSPRLLALEVFADPELTLGLPAGVTAATGLDAITHLVEARIARGFQPLCDGIAMEGLRLAAANLKQCVEFARAKTGATPEHIAARGAMLNASMMGAVAFQKGLGVTHSLAHSLSTVHDLHHGLANGIMIDYAMEFNASAAGDVFVLMAEAVGAKQKSAAGFVDWLKQLKADVGLPAGLKSAGLEATRLDDLVKFAELDVCHQLNPRAVATADFRKLYEAAFAA